MSSFSGKLLRVNLSKGEGKVELIPEQVQKQFLGARGFAIKYLFEELFPGTDPLSEKNKLIIGVGPLAGTGAQGFSKWVVGTKSPLSGTIARSICGGTFGAFLKFAGFDLLIIEGKATKPVYIYIENGKSEILDASGVWGLDTEETQTRLNKIHGPTCGIACIGPAGEKLVRYASIASGRRTASRLGVGAVMGSKNVKAIVVKGANKVVPQNPEAFERLLRQTVEILMHRTNKRRVRFTEEGTTSMVQAGQTLNITPVRNFQEGRLPGVEKLFAAEFNRFKVKNSRCWGCATQCGQIRKVNEGLYKGFLTDGPEYEAIFALGFELCNTEPTSIIAADVLCDLLGIDVISTGVSIGFACELFERGILSRRDTDGLELTWGNHQAFVSLVEKIGKRQGFGRLLGEGVRRTAEQIGKGAEKYAIHVKGVEMAGYEPRAVKGYALSYAVSNMGAIHMYARPTKEIAGETDPLVEEDKAESIAKEQKTRAVDDSLIRCTFGTSGISPELINAMAAAATGFEEFADNEYLDMIGERIVTLERTFNVREKFSRDDDTLPPRFLVEPLTNAGRATGQVVRRLDAMVDEYYTIMGYNREGIPTGEKLRSLGLEEVANKIT